MNILITGAYGFLGRYTAKKFKSEGHQVIGIGHGKWYESEYKKWGIDYWYESTITFEALINMNKELDIIIHCGGSGSVGFSYLNPYEDFQKTVQSTLSLLEFIRLKCPKCKFVYPSSPAVQGNLPDLPIKEDMLSVPVSPYGFNKKIAEELCLSYNKNYNVIIGIVRFFSIYGEGLKKQLLYEACKKIKEVDTNNSVEFFGTGDETRDWLYVADAANLIYTIATKVQNYDIVNGGSGTKSNIKTIINLLVKNFDKSINVKFSGQTREGDPIYFWADTNKVKQYGWEPVMSLEKGISKYVDYFNQLND